MERRKRTMAIAAQLCEVGLAAVPIALAALGGVCTLHGLAVRHGGSPASSATNGALLTGFVIMAMGTAIASRTRSDIGSVRVRRVMLWEIRALVALTTVAFFLSPVGHEATVVGTSLVGLVHIVRSAERHVDPST